MSNAAYSLDCEIYCEIIEGFNCKERFQHKKDAYKRNGVKEYLIVNVADVLYDL